MCSVLIVVKLKSDSLRRPQQFGLSSTYNLKLLSNVEKKVEDGLFFVALSEYLNFKPIKVSYDEVPLFFF